jgi:hypothetical protein
VMVITTWMMEPQRAGAGHIGEAGSTMKGGIVKGNPGIWQGVTRGTSTEGAGKGTITTATNRTMSTARARIDHMAMGSRRIGSSIGSGA